MCGYEAGDPHWVDGDAQALAAAPSRASGRLAVAVTTDAPNGVPVADCCVEAAHAAADLLAELGHDVREAAPDWHDCLPREGREPRPDYEPPLRAAVPLPGVRRRPSRPRLARRVRASAR